MIEKVRKFIADHNLLQRNGRYIVALSGGADSVALLLVLRQQGYAVEAAHCNFHLRGEESQRDEIFVKSLCQKHNIPLHLVHFDTRTYAELHKVSLEMAARELRYCYFEQLRKDIGATAICVAHHQDDSVETILMNLIRGTGIHGLTGIQPRLKHIIRPLLCVSRCEIETWLKEQEQDFITDSSNLVADVWRNKLRLNVIPQLLDITPQASKNILHTASLLSETVKVNDDAILKARDRIINDSSLSINSLLKEPSPLSILFSWLEPLGFSSASIMQICQKLPSVHSGNTWFSDSHDLCVDRGRLIVQPHEAARPTLRIPEPGTYIYDSTTKFRVKLSTEPFVSREPDVATLDAESISFPLTVRPALSGDRFQPLGMKEGSRLVSDFLTDRKMSLFDKRRQLVVLDARERILWVAGLRPDNRFRVNEATRRMLSIEQILLN